MDNKTENLALIRQLQETTKAYSLDTIKTAIAETTLNESQIRLALSSKNLKGELLETTAAQLAETTTLNALSASEAVATGTTVGLGAAFQGLAASLGISTVALGALIAGAAAIGIIAVGCRQYAKHLEEVRQETAEAADIYKDSSSSVEEYASKYQSLHSALLDARGDEEKTCQIKKQLLALQTELNDKFGDAYGSINLVTDAYKDQTDAIRAYGKEAAQTFLNENTEGIEDAAKAMTRKRHYNLSYTGISSATEKGKALRDVAEKYAGQGVTTLDENGDGSVFSIHLKTDAQSAYDTINAFASELRDKAKELGDAHMFDDVLEISSSELNRARSVIEDYGEIFNHSLTAEIATDDDKAVVYGDAMKAVEEYNSAVLNSEDPFSDKTVEKAREKLEEIKGLINNDSGWDKYAPVVNSVFEQADTSLLDFNDRMQTDTGMKKLAQDLSGMDRTDLSSLTPGENASFDILKESANKCGLQVNDLIDTLIRLGYIQEEIQEEAPAAKDLSPDIFHDDIIDGLEKQVKPVMSAVQNAWQDAYDAEGEFALDPDKALDAVSSIKNAIDSLNNDETLGMEIDTSSLENLSSVLTNAESTEEEVRNAYSRIVDAVMNEFLPAMQGMDGSQFPLMQSFLESMGIMNAEALLIQSLGYSYETYTAAKEAAVNTGASLNADINETAALLEAEGLMASDDAQQIMAYMLAKYAVSGGTISVGDTISELSKEYSWLADMIDQWGLYYDTSNKEHGKTSGNKNSGGGKHTSSAAAGSERNEPVELPGSPRLPSTRSRNGAAAKTAKTETDALSGLNSGMDKLQSAYKSLCDIRDTYNRNGKITADQYQELTNTGFLFLSQLADENGQLGLNAGAFERLSQAKLQEMQIQMARNAADTISGLKTEAAAVEYLTYANEQLRDAALGAAEAQLAAAVADAEKRGGRQAEAARQIYQGYQTAKQMAAKVDFSFTPAASPSSPAPQPEPAKTEPAADPMDAYNREKSLLEHMLAMDQISKAEYYEKLLALAKGSFGDDEAHQDQIRDAEESYHDYLESIRETYNWIEIFLENLSKKTSALIDKAGKFISWSKKNAMINRAVKATDKQITGQNTAYAYYAEKARRVGLSNTYTDKIQNGTLTMEDMQNEALSDKIEKYQEWYDRMTACQDAVSELYDQERDLIRQKMDNVLAYYNDLDSYMSSIVSKMDSFITLTDDMGRRSSLSDLLKQFAAASEQIAHFQSQTTTASGAPEKNLFEPSERVKAAEAKEKQELTASLEAQKTHAESGVKNTGTYKKIERDIQKAKDDEAKKKAQAEAAKGTRFAASRQAAYDKAKKKREELEAKLNLKLEALEKKATANTAAEYARLYDTEQTLLARKAEKEAAGKTLSEKDARKLADTQARMAQISGGRASAITDLENQLAIVKGEKAGETETEKLQKQLEAITGREEDKDKKVGTGIAESATYQKLLKDIAGKEAEVSGYDGRTLSAGDQKKRDRARAALDALKAKRAELEAHATAGNIGEYSTVYDKWRKLQDKLDAGTILTTGEWKKYNTYQSQLNQFADERNATVKSLKEQLEKIQNPGDKTENINREYEEASEGIRESYKAQTDSIDSGMKASTQYKNLLAKKQRLENKRDSSKTGLSVSEEKELRKYTAELEALEQGATGNNIADYMKTWEKWYTLQQKIDDGKTLTAKEASNYDNLKSDLENWNTEKQSQISDLLSLMEDDLEKLGKTRDENLSDAESEVNSYYSKVYGLAKQIAEYNLSALNEQLSCLDACISYYSDLASLYDRFSGDKLSRLMTDLDEDALSGQVSVYEKYLDTLTSKYDATLSQINEYKQLLEAIDTNDFQASMSLFRKAMESYQASGNTEMADRLQAVLDLLNERAASADNWEEYADLWAGEWEQALADAKSGLIETAGSIQEINDALREVRFSGITDAIGELNRADGILSSMSGLIQDAWLYDGGGLSEYGKARAALLVSQLENAQNKAEEYLELTKRIGESRDTYASDTAWQEALSEASQNYYSTLSDAASTENAIMDLMRQAKEEEVTGWKDIIAARKEALQAKKSYYDYDRNLKEKNRNIDALRAELAALNDIGTAQAKARRAKLEAELAQAEEERETARTEHEFSISTGALDDYAKTLEEALAESTGSVQETLEYQQKVIEEAKELYRTSTDAVEETMQKVTDFYRLAGERMDTFLSSLPETDIAAADIRLPETAGALEGIPSSEREAVEINIHYDSMLNIEGNVDKDALPELQGILEKSYDYTTKRLYSELRKTGYGML